MTGMPRLTRCDLGELILDKPSRSVDTNDTPLEEGGVIQNVQEREKYHWVRGG